MALGRRKGAHQVHVQTPEAAIRVGELGQWSPDVPPDLGGLAGVAFPAPLPDVPAHVAPHKTLCHGSQGGPWPRVAEPMERLEDVPGEHRWDDGAYPTGGYIAPEFLALEPEEPRLQA